MTDDFQTLFASLHILLERGEFMAAAALLADQAPAMLDQGQQTHLEALLAAFPAPFTDENTELRYVSGLVRAQAGDHEAARNLLERARFAFLLDQNFAKATSAALAIVRLHFRLDNIFAANHYLQDVIRPLIDGGQVTDQRLHGLFYYFCSEISSDLGQLAQGVEYAQRAFLAYQNARDVAGQFMALIRLVSALTHLGNYVEAEAKLDAAQSWFAVGNLGARAQMRLLNATIHLYWYQARWEQAMTAAQAYLTLVDREPQSNFRVLARVLLGNLLRATGDYAGADAWYTTTRPLIGQLVFERYSPWVDVQTGWLRILEGRTGEARLLLNGALRNADLGEAMSFQVGLAVVNLLEGHLPTAERLLQESLAYYTRAADGLATCAIRCYLGLVALRRGQLAAGLEYLNLALGWLAQQHLDYFPHWWHPQLLSEVCVQALRADLYPEVAERILVFHLGEVGVAALRPLLTAENSEAHTHAERVLRLIEARRLDLLAPFADSPGKRVLAQLLQQGQLRRECFDQLQSELMTAHERAQPNPTALAIFALYVIGYQRTEIALRVACSLANVRNYITFFYRHFGLADQQFATRNERRQRLSDLARERGYIP
jgi:tetratricopeptide (TPR) repeat protein